MYTGSTSLAVEIAVEARIDQLVASMPLAAHGLRIEPVSITGPSIPRFFGLRGMARIEKDPNAPPQPAAASALLQRSAPVSAS